MKDSARNYVQPKRIDVWENAEDEAFAIYFDGQLVASFPDEWSFVDDLEDGYSGSWVCLLEGLFPSAEIVVWAGDLEVEWHSRTANGDFPETIEVVE